jgi:hypothetical protein
VSPPASGAALFARTRQRSGQHHRRRHPEASSWLWAYPPRIIRYSHVSRPLHPRCAPPDASAQGCAMKLDVNQLRYMEKVRTKQAMLAADT